MFVSYKVMPIKLVEMKIILRKKERKKERKEERKKKKEHIVLHKHLHSRSLACSPRYLLYIVKGIIDYHPLSPDKR